MSIIDRPELFIDGGWRAPLDGELVEVRNPSTNETFATAALGGTQDIDAAVDAARRSFDSGEWANASAADRSEVLSRAADLLDERSAEISELITSELGTPVWFNEGAHVPNAIRHTRTFAGLTRDFHYVEERGDGQRTSLVIQEPVGVVAAITPWNGPLSTPALKIAPALGAGCSVVLKPPPETPLTAHAFADVFTAAGLPSGVLNIVPAGRDEGQHLVDHPQVDKISFTGSTAAGKKIMASAASRVARVSLELGGKSAAILLPDADVRLVVPALLPMVTLVNGQACIAQTRVLVPRTMESQVIDALADAMSSVRIGDPMDRDTALGPMVSERQRSRVVDYISLGRTEGARVAIGGEGRPSLSGKLAQGWFVSPTLLTNVDNTMRVAREEIFGPVVAVIPYDTIDDAVAIANDSDYGLSGSVWGSDTDLAMAVSRRVRTGMVSINGAAQANGAPFGGYKQSGLGREMGPEGFSAYLETKSIAV